jgi:hypothetical protein
MDVTPLQVELAATVDQEPEQLLVRLTLTNRSPARVAIVDRVGIIAPDGTMDLSPRNALVDLEDGVLILRKALLAAPPELLAFATPVDSGRTLEQLMALVLPVRVMSPPRRAALGAVAVDRQALARELVVQLGAVPIDDSLQLLPENPAFPGALTIFPAALAEERQRLVTCRVALKAAVSVLDYRVL